VKDDSSQNNGSAPSRGEEGALLPDAERSCQVAVEVAAPGLYTYKIPDGWEVKVGQAVRVPFGHRESIGYVTGVGTGKGDLKAELKAILEIVREDSLFGEEIARLARFISAYYFYPEGLCFKEIIPGGLAPKLVKKYALTPQGYEDLQGTPEALKALASPDKGSAPKDAGPSGPADNLDPDSFDPDLIDPDRFTPSARPRAPHKADEAKSGAAKALRTLLAAYPEGETAAKFASAAERRKIQELIGAGQARGYHEFSGKAIAYKYEYYLTPLKGPGASLPRLGSAELRFWEMIQGAPATPLSHFRHFFPNALSLSRSLARKELIHIEEREITRVDRARAIDLPTGSVTALTDEQALALGAIAESLEKGGNRGFLLFGVTGSGKTEIYLRAAQKALEKGRSVLWLAPEIALTMGLEARVRKGLPDLSVAVLHSQLSSGERHDHWLNLARGRARLALGARSAVFAPMRDLGLIIVDEEHDWAYKQEDGLRYNGRDLAAWRAKERGATLILGSATPSLESFEGTRAGRLELLVLRHRPLGSVLPEVIIEDTRLTPRGSKIISRPLREALKDAFARREQALLFINRKGYASLPMCAACGAILKCPHCAISLTLHGPEGPADPEAEAGETAGIHPGGFLTCHGCGYRAKPRLACPECGAGMVRYMGVGTEKLHAMVEKDFPATGLRLDAETTRHKGGFKEILETFGQRKADFLVGTQMAAKGHDFAYLTVVGVVDADIGLNLPDFRAAERTYQLLSQVAGRAGRAERPGKVIIQTQNPEHYSLRAAQLHDYDHFYQCEIKIRRELLLPPFGRLALLGFSGADEREASLLAENGVGRLRDLIKEMELREVEILGPAPSPVSRLKDQYRFQAMVVAKSVSVRHALLRAFLPEFRKKLKKTVKFVVDVDPYHLM
jgi:primosomal protein N' (replication factor Y)